MQNPRANFKHEEDDVRYNQNFSENWERFEPMRDSGFILYLKYNKSVRRQKQEKTQYKGSKSAQVLNLFIRTRKTTNRTHKIYIPVAH